MLGEHEAERCRLVNSIKEKRHGQGKQQPEERQEEQEAEERQESRPQSGQKVIWTCGTPSQLSGGAFAILGKSFCELSNAVADR
jgi:hypothetical protein